MRMREHIEHAFDCKRIRGIDSLDAAFGDRGRDHEAVGKPGQIVFAGVFGNSGDLHTCVDARGRLAEMTAWGHGALPLT